MKNEIDLTDYIMEIEKVPDESVDLILCDIPHDICNYVGAKKYDEFIFEMGGLWKEFRRVTKNDATIVMFGQEMFTAEMMIRNSDLWRYNLIWNKVEQWNGEEILKSRNQPMGIHEDIMIFAKGNPVYHPHIEKGKVEHIVKPVRDIDECEIESSQLPLGMKLRSNDKYPESIMTFKKTMKTGLYKKPWELFEWLIETYTSKEMMVMDMMTREDTICAVAGTMNRNSVAINKGESNLGVIGEIAFMKRNKTL